MFQKKFPFQYYLVGGQVRDKLLGLPSKDADFVVVGSTPEELKKFGLIQVGKSFPVFKDPKSSDEYALARKEIKTAQGHQGFEFDFNPNITLEEDLYRRDFTVNAMCMDHQGNLIDPYGGQKDLALKILRHVSPHFVEDPLRIFRAAKFSARLNFSIAEPTLDLMKKMVAQKEIDHLSIERIKAEFEGAMVAKRFEKFAEVLEILGIWKDYQKDFNYFKKLQDSNSLEHQWIINGALLFKENLGQVSEWIEKYKLSNAILTLTKNLILFLNWDNQNSAQTLKLLSCFQDGKDKQGIEAFSHLINSFQKIQTADQPWQLLQKLFQHFRQLDLSKASSAEMVAQMRSQHLKSFVCP